MNLKAKLEKVEFKVENFLGIEIYFNHTWICRWQDTTLRQLLINVTCRPVISRDGLLKFSRTDSSYFIEDTETTRWLYLCSSGIRKVFDKHPLKVGQSINFYLKEV